MRIQESGSIALALLALGGSVGHAEQPLQPGDAGPVNEQDGSDWPGVGRTFSNNHYSPLDQISSSSIQRLSLAWYHDLDTGQRTDSQPVESDGTLYVATGESVVRALDAQTGKLRWRYDPESGKAAGAKLRASWGIRGLGFWAGRVFVGTTDGRLISLNAATGKVVWSVLTLDKNDETTINGAPLLFKGKVLIGFSGGDRSGARGAVNCYDALTGRHLWRFYTVPGDPAKGFEDDAMKRAAATWSGQWWKNGGGGVVWNGLTYDPEFDRVYIGTGNADVWNPAVRNPEKKDNLFTASLIALDADTGRYLWHYQENPNDAWDYDSIADIELATLMVEGRPRQVLLHAPKNGFFYVIDRVDGKLISAEKLDKVTWAERIEPTSGRPVEAPGIRYETKPVLVWPGNYGVHNWPAMSYSPKDRLVFIPAIHAAMVFDGRGVDVTGFVPQKNTWTTGLGGGDLESGPTLPVAEFGSSLQAWNPQSQSEAWRTPTAGTWAAGTMATGGGLVFQGQLDGTFAAYDSRQGSKLWSFNAGVAVLGAPISYLAGGRQYVTVLSGPTSGTAAATHQASDFGWRYRDHPRRVLTFALDGTATLPPAVPPGPAVPVASAEAIDPGRAKRGAAPYATHCQHCHGFAAVSGGAAPDLRASAITHSSAAFADVVQRGVLVPRGMPRFDEFTNDDSEAIRLYVLERATADARAAGVVAPADGR